MDFGFPVGYLATEVDNETVTVVAKNADGETRSTVTCDGSVCEVEEAD